MKKLLTLSLLFIFTFSHTYSHKLDLKVYLEGKYNSGNPNIPLNYSNLNPKLNNYCVEDSPRNNTPVMNSEKIKKIISGTFTGNIKTELGTPLENSTTTLKQLTDYDNIKFTELGSTQTDQNGNFTLISDEVTDVEKTDNTNVQSRLKAYTRKNKLTLSEFSNVKVGYYTLEGRLIGKIIELNNLSPGEYNLPNKPKNIANQVFFRRTYVDGIPIVQKLLQLDGHSIYAYSDGQIKKAIATTTKNKTGTFNKTQNTKNYSTDSLYFKIKALENNGFKADSTIIAVKDDGMDVFISDINLIQEKIKEYITGQFQINAQNSATQQGIKTEVKTLEQILPTGNYELVSTDTTDQNGQLDLFLEQLDNTYKNQDNTKLMKFIFKAIEGNYNQLEQEETFPITNNQITGNVTGNLEEITSGKTYNWTMSVSNLLDEMENNIEVTLTNKGNGVAYKDTSDATGTLQYNMTNITNPEFILTFVNLTEPGREIDKMKLRTIKTRTLDDGSQADLVYNIDGSDWNDNGTIVNITNPEHFWFFEKGYELWYSKGADELQQMTINADEVDSYIKDGKPINLVIIADEYESNTSVSFPNGKIKLSDPKLQDYYDEPGNNQFRKDRVLYALRSRFNQTTGVEIFQAAIDRLVNVSEMNYEFMSQSSLKKPYIKIIKDWVVDVQSNEYTNKGNQIMYTYFSNDIGNSSSKDKNGQIFIVSASMQTNSPYEAYPEEITEGNIGADAPAGYSATATNIWDFENKKYNEFGKAWNKYNLILDFGENREPR